MDAMSNVTVIAQHQAPHNIAAARLFHDRWENRVTALANCVEHLITEHDIPEERAELIAVQAYADLEATNQRARIEVDACTSQVVVLRTEDGSPAVFTVTDLVQLLEQARRDHRALVVDRHRERPIVLEH